MLEPVWRSFVNAITRCVRIGHYDRPKPQILGLPRKCMNKVDPSLFQNSRGGLKLRKKARRTVTNDEWKAASRMIGNYQISLFKLFPRFLISRQISLLKIFPLILITRQESLFTQSNFEQKHTLECALVSGHNLIFFFTRRNQLCLGRIIRQSIASRSSS